MCGCEGAHSPVGVPGLGAGKEPDHMTAECTTVEVVPCFDTRVQEKYRLRPHAWLQALEPVLDNYITLTPHKSILFETDLVPGKVKMQTKRQMAERRRTITSYSTLQAIERFANRGAQHMTLECRHLRNKEHRQGSWNALVL